MLCVGLKLAQHDHKTVKQVNQLSHRSDPIYKCSVKLSAFLFWSMSCYSVWSHVVVFHCMSKIAILVFNP